MKNSLSGKKKTWLWVACVFSVSLLLDTQQVHAQKPDSTSKAAQVQYTGVSNNRMHFAVSYPNSEGKPFVIYITDDDGQVLYEQKFVSTDFRKIFAIDQQDYVSGRISFVVKAGRRRYTETFNFTAEKKHVVSEVLITKL